MRRRWVVAIVLAVLAVPAACGDDDGEDATPDRPDGYLALGDSFSAGVGAPPYDEASGACDRSERSWPYVLDDAMGDVRLLEVRACGGARSQHLIGEWDSRGLPAQVSDEPNRDVGLVTLTIGGNDIGFGDLVATCVLGDCSGVPTSDEFTGRLTDLSATLVDDVYPALRAAYPVARIVHVGYPRLAPADGDLPLVCLWLSGAEQRATAAIVDQLNDAIADAARASDADVEFVDIGGVFAEHELCTDEPWVQPIDFNDERAHPAPEGYAAMAAAVAEALA